MVLCMVGSLQPLARLDGSPLHKRGRFRRPVFRYWAGTTIKSHAQKNDLFAGNLSRRSDSSDGVGQQTLVPESGNSAY
jgi:hypothetical protein